MKCPHCRRGELANPLQYHFPEEKTVYTCTVCRRGWYQDKEKKWHSMFAADVEVYSEDGETMLDNSTQHIRD